MSPSFSPAVVSTCIWCISSPQHQPLKPKDSLQQEGRQTTLMKGSMSFPFILKEILLCPTPDLRTSCSTPVMSNCSPAKAMESQSGLGWKGPLKGHLVQALCSDHLRLLSVFILSFIQPCTSSAFASAQLSTSALVELWRLRCCLAEWALFLYFKIQTLLPAFSEAQRGLAITENSQTRFFWFGWPSGISPLHAQLFRQAWKTTLQENLIPGQDDKQNNYPSQDTTNHQHKIHIR